MSRVSRSMKNLNADQRRVLFGPNDHFIQILNEVFDCDLQVDADELVGECKNDGLIQALDEMIQLVLENKEMNEVDVRVIAENFVEGKEVTVERLYDRPVGRSFEHKMIYPKTMGQKILLDTLMEKDMTFVSGPAGTGKTFLAVVYAVTQLRNETVKRLIVTRPVVEAGENLGFLPGDLKEKVDPYLRPIYDALYFTLGQMQTERYIEKGIIEIAPLAYMRGRTLDDAIIILDEAQNTTTMQMKMFLTRMGFHSKMIITGDMTQVDLPSSKHSGFVDALHRLQDIDEIGFVNLQNTDVVRHPLVKKILTHYED
ncbi:MAG: PhoH family protein [Erysipelotrichaceae bacterium]|nr:PhoH family protein [Erysipelotrichaceae bacterium]